MPNDWKRLLADATDDFARLVGTADPTAPVPACPGWTVADLVDHLGGIHQWARHAVVEGNPDGVPEPAPADHALLAQWYAAHAAALRGVLTDPAAEAWTFDRSDRTAGWWLRRQTHETRMHTWDLLSAQGRETDWAIDPALAWDGVDEVATVFYPRQVRLDRTEPVPATLRLRATDLPDAPPIEIGEADPLVEVSGPAVELLLALWHRRTHDDPTAAALLARPLTP